MKRETHLIAMERRLATRMARGFVRILGRDAGELTDAAKDDLAAFLAEERAAMGQAFAAALPVKAVRTLRRQVRVLICLVALLLGWLAWQTWWFHTELQLRTPTATQIHWMMQGYALDQEKETP